MAASSSSNSQEMRSRIHYLTGTTFGRAGSLWSQHVSPRLPNTRSVSYMTTRTESKYKGETGRENELELGSGDILPASSRWNYVRSFVGRNRNGVGTSGEPPLTSEHIVCFPQTVKYIKRDGKSLEIAVTGYAYSTSSQLSRSQRVLFSIAKRLAALPSVTLSRPPSIHDNEADATRLREESGMEELINSNDVGKDEIFSTLVQAGDRSNDDTTLMDDAGAEVPEHQPSVITTTPQYSNPQQPLPTQSLPPFDSPSPIRPVIVKTDTARTGHSMRSQSDRSRPHPSNNSWPLPFSYTVDDLPRLHHNLSTRLAPFFGQKLVGREVLISIYPVFSSGRIAERPLVEMLTTTKTGGTFAESVGVSSKQMKRFMDVEDVKQSEMEGMKLKVVVELTRGDLGEGGQGTIDSLELSISRDEGVRVVSDIDDTIKYTEVLSSSRTIFRNVFVRELDEIRVPGMADWYREMGDLGAAYDYVSNGPIEIYRTIEEFLSLGDFPQGSITLKDYGGEAGITSKLSKLFEDAGARKKAGVERIMKSFPKSKFIFVGDSGEQDLPLYVSLAQIYPSQVLAIFIRDVTTPFNPKAHPTTEIYTDVPSTVAELDDVPGSFEPRPHLPVRSISAPMLLKDPSTDLLSPNNPTTTTTTTEEPEHLSEERVALIETFYDRIAQSERVLPRHIPLRIFRHGRECREEGCNLVRMHRGSNLQ